MKVEEREKAHLTNVGCGGNYRETYPDEKEKICSLIDSDQWAITVYGKGATYRHPSLGSLEVRVHGGGRERTAYVYQK